MNLADYQQLTGQSVPDTRKAALEAALDRAQGLLEELVGFALNPMTADENQYEEAGQVAGASLWLSCDYLDNATLQPADAVIGAYRLFDFDPRDVHLPIDPATAIHAVKLVVGNVTVKTFNPQHYSLKRQARGGWGKFLSLRNEWLLWYQSLNWDTCLCGRHLPQLAVDADWMPRQTVDLPNDLAFVLAEMGNYYADPKRNVRSESRGTRSFTLATVLAPQDDPANAGTIRRYAGPNGSVAGAHIA